jgi:iron complex outermembrane recepter protein
MKFHAIKLGLMLGVAISGLSASQPAWGAEDGDIVVTAQRREELLHQVPISITALNADALDKAGVNNLQDLERVTPGLQLPLYGGFLRPSIRGISSGLSTLNDSSNVAVYVDGVYQPIQNGAIVDLPDVDTVQVLKGPQGTLYGQNATGGAIIIDTVRPRFETAGEFALSYGNYNEIMGRGLLTAPVTDKIAVLISGSVADRDGFNRDLVRGGRDKGLRSAVIRGKILFEPSDRASFLLGAFYTDRRDSNPFATTPLNGNALGNALVRLYQGLGLLPANTPIASKPHEFASTFPPDLTTWMWGVNLKGKLEIGEFGTLDTVSAYQKFRTQSNLNVDSSAIHLANVDPLVTRGDFYLQELNFASEKFGGFYFTTGLFFLHREEEFWPSNFTGFGFVPNANPFDNILEQINGVPDFVQNTYARSKKNSYAAYLELNYDLTEQLTVTLAGRYSYEKVRVSQNSFLSSLLNDPTQISDPRGSHSFKKFTPRAVLTYKVNPDHTVYASYSKGFKSGFVDFSAVGRCPGGPQDFSCIPDPVRPETVDSFEVGYKGRIGGVLNVSLAAFHYKYKQIQVFIYRAPTGFYQNAAAGRVNGFDFDLAWEATPELTLTVGGSYVDSKYTSFPGAEVYFQSPQLTAQENAAHLMLNPGATSCQTRMLPFPCGNYSVPVDVSGNQFQNAPEFTATANVDYRREINAGTFGINVGLTYNSGFPFDVGNHIRQKEYVLLGGELSFAPAGVEGLRLVVWGKNLTNKDYLAGSLPTTFGDSVQWSPPRTFGGRIELRF